MDISNKYIGLGFGRLKVIGAKRENNKTRLLCNCSCKSEAKWYDLSNLKSGHTKSCGCLRKKVDRRIGYKRKRDIKNQKFGKLTAVEATKKRSAGGNILWRCICDCGGECNVSSLNLTQGQTKSCGCLHKEYIDSVCIDGTNKKLITKEKPYKSNASGVSGVHFVEKDSKWIARIGFKKERYYLGYFSTKEEAIKARKAAEERYYKPFLKELEAEND